METKVLKVVVTERKTNDGRKFNTYHTFTKNGMRVDLKFRKTVTNVPSEKCSIIVDVDNMSYNKSGEFPVLWVSKIESIGEYNTVDTEKNRELINEVFA